MIGMGRKGLNPADAHRRAQKEKQKAKNKKQRELGREAKQILHRPDELKKKLEGILAEEEREAIHAKGEGAKGVSLKRQVYQKAYEASIVKQKEREHRQRREERAERAAAEARGEVMPARGERQHQQHHQNQQHRRPPAQGIARAPRPSGRPPHHQHQHRPHPPAPPAVASASPAQGSVTVVAAPALTIKRAEKSEGLIAMVPASLRNKQRQGAAMVKKQKKNLFGLAPAASNLVVESAKQIVEEKAAGAGAADLEPPKAKADDFGNFMSELGDLGAFDAS